MGREKIRKNRNMPKRIIKTLLIVVCVLAVIGGYFVVARGITKSEPQIISKSNLEKIIDVSELSTLEAVYNGIAKVYNEQDENKIDYYVSYNAKVKAGIDFKKVTIVVNEKEKKISVKIPAIKITDINVDITSLDYIFLNNNANTSTVSEQAYKKCIEDVTQEANDENAIYKLAEENAKNTIEALLKPFVTQVDSDYVIEIS